MPYVDRRRSRSSLTLFSRPLKAAVICRSIQNSHMPQPHSRHSVSFKIGDQPVPGYRLARELGRGTFGVVWLAVTENGFERALKVVNLEQKGGKKEFRALRLIKDRKILHGNLLTLIDYWLLDRDGTIISAPNNVAVDTHIPPPKAGSSIASTAVSGDRGAQGQMKPGIQGTMIPSALPETSAYSIRDTFQHAQLGDTKEEENSQAIWLVVAMELGHKTLHDRQKEFSQDLSAKTLSKLARRGKTQNDKQGDTDAGSHTVADRNSQTHASEEDELAALPADEVLPYMEQAARGLDYLHRCDIVHRDIKPQNIMLVGDVAKVCDYGLASELGDIRATTNAFTLPYAAPEAINKAQPSPASDQYSLAVTYVELRTGRWPFISNTSTAVYAAKDTGVHHLKFVPNRNVRAVLKRALTKKPEDRFSSCGEFVKQLAKAEATRFNLFATVQAMLATLAIVTVLLAAAATHPDVWARIRPFLPQQVVLPVSPSTFDLAAYQSRLQSAEQLLHQDKRAEALSAFGALYDQLAQVPEKELEIRRDVTLGLARARAGAAGVLNHAEQKAAIAQLIEPLLDQPATPLPAKQALWAHYLQVILLEKERSQEVGPESQLAKDSLANWERQLWKDALLRHEAPELKELLDKVIAKRLEATDVSLDEARKTFDQLREKSAMVPDLAASLRHQLDVEEFHLNYAQTTPPAENLTALKSYLEIELALEQDLIDRIQVLQLLTLKAIKGDEFYLGNEEVATAVIALKPELFVAPRLESLSFAPAEIETVEQMRVDFIAEVRQAAVLLPDIVITALPHFLPKREAFRLLADRLRGHLVNVDLKENQLPAINFAWQDLVNFQDREYPLSSLSDSELADALQTEADLSLEVSFADPKVEPAEALKNFVDRVVKSGAGAKWLPKLLSRAQQDPQWVKAAAGPLQSLLSSPPDDLSRHRQFAEWKSKVESLLLRDVLHTDPANPEIIHSILATLASNAGDGKGPLPSLLRVECEMLLAAEPAPEKLAEWETRIDRALTAIGSSDPELKGYGNFVRARLLASRGNVFQQEEAAKLIGEILKQPQLPTWLTSARRQGIGDIFAISAIQALQLDDEDILRFADLSPATSSQLAVLQTAASAGQVQSPALQVIAGIVEATQGEKADWKKVQQWIAAGRSDPRATLFLQRYNAARLVEYLEVLANLRLAPTNKPLAPKIVQGFYSLLLAKQDDQFVYFNFNEGPRDDDEGVLQNIINPVLLHSAVAKDAKDPAKELAFLWGAKGRLLQRSPLIVSVDPAKEADQRDSGTVAISLSNQAFDRARQLDDNINYLVGYGRTLAAVPAESAVRDDRLQQLYALVDQYDPQGTSPNLGMRFLSAYVLRFRSYDKSDIPNIQLAGTRYEAVLKELPADDPFDLDALCREGLSDIHLRLAFLTPHVTPNEVRSLLAGQDPPPNTKAHHLQLAVKYALQATQSSGRNLKENAYTALANAYEDYAYYLGLTENYAKSKEAFGFAISSARERGLPVAKAQMNYGRCLYRYAIDPFAGLAKNEERIEILNLAVSQLNEAVESGKLRPSDEVEAWFWLAVDKRAIGNLSNAATKTSLNEEALAHFHQAAEAAAKYQLADMLLLTLTQESEAAIDLYSIYTVAKDPIRQPKVFKQAQAIDEQAYQLFAKKPSAANPSQVTTLAGNASIIWRGEAPKRTRWLEGSPAIKAQWDANDTWKFEAITLRLNYALLSEGKDEVRKARATLVTMKDPRLKNLAESRILDFEAGVEYRAFEEVVSNQKDITQEKLREEVEKPLLLYIAAKKFHDQIMDSETKALLDRINATASTQLKTLSRELTTTEKKRVADVLTRAPDIEFRKRLFKLCNLSLLTMGADAKLAPKKNERARIGHDCIKPFYVFADNELIFAGLRDLKDKHQVGLDKFESQLKVAGDKFDGKPR